MPWYWFAAFAIFCTSALIEFIWTISATRARRPLGIIGIIITIYFLVLISFVAWMSGVDYYPIRSGTVTIIGVCMLGLLHIADIIARQK